MMRKAKIILGLAIAALSSPSVIIAATDNLFIAGINPDQRPANTPIILEAFKDQAWYAKALTGVTQPYPNSLRFLDDQGNWYTPFNRPGMTGRYDIRGWHRSSN
ncbi:exported hypothetical protein [Candidatus Competibacter denitrificans Run_A_D11]|jgi:hypothetical protein|uniref:Uncharacterized protein n=1 Tax=Candidatus Competibacter denitrificans Run_A_D11 TaxID=1400863 RepID=W6MC65_9GAMM|nr:hypothetical protein [Candidatus Competibacter denitrificans]CDI03900.1 exported hypothetical protein [Candidatus Competibacter denitrificans Run_A_D11]